MRLARLVDIKQMTSLRMHGDNMEGSQYHKVLLSQSWLRLESATGEVPAESRSVTGGILHENEEEASSGSIPQANYISKNKSLDKAVAAFRHAVDSEARQLQPDAMHEVIPCIDLSLRLSAMFLQKDMFHASWSVTNYSGLYAVGLKDRPR